MSEEMEGYRQFNKKDLIDAKPLFSPERDEEIDLSRILETAPDPYGIPEEMKNEVRIFRNSILHAYLEYHFRHFGPIKIICNINDLASFYNNNHKKEISYDAIKFALRIIGYITNPQYYSDGCRTNHDDIIFGVDSEGFQELKRYFETNRDHDHIRIEYVTKIKCP
ncbi:MAG: hypothetical protein M0Q13_10415 [Methanothrix sp.]|jgi:hypothetical protein|nr:hypothetical protein [Methanothrix sp.]